MLPLFRTITEDYMLTNMITNCDTLALPMMITLCMSARKITNFDMLVLSMTINCEILARTITNCDTYVCPVDDDNRLYID